MPYTSTATPFTWDTADFTWEYDHTELTWDTASLSFHTLTLDESLSLAEACQRHATALCHVSLPVSARLCQSISIPRTESAPLTASYLPHTHYRRTATDTLRLSSADHRSSTVTHASILSLTGSTKRTTTLTRTESAPLTTSYLPHTHYRRTATDTLRLSSADHRSSTVTHASILSLTDTIHRTKLLTCTEALTLAPSYLPHTHFYRTAQEPNTLTDSIRPHTTITARESLPLQDDRLTPVQGILSDITFTATPLTDELWHSASTSPSGYEPFHPFEVGEYTYRDALIRLVLTAGAEGVAPLLYDVAFHVDIEDIREHGLADCTATAPTRITLTRQYHHPPRIALTLIGATGSILPTPHLISQNTDSDGHYFLCELRTPDGTRTNGTISYLAEGY